MNQCRDQSCMQQFACLQHRWRSTDEVQATSAQQCDDKQRVRFAAAGPGNKTPTLANAEPARTRRRGPRAGREIFDDRVVIEHQVIGLSRDESGLGEQFSDELVP